MLDPTPARASRGLSLLVVLALFAACATPTAKMLPPGSAEARPSTSSGFFYDDATDGAVVRSQAPNVGFDDFGTNETPDLAFAALASASDVSVDLRAAEPSPDERKMIYTAGLRLQVPRVEEAIDRFLAAVRERAGYLAQRRNSTITCRVPVERFSELIEELRTYGRVLHENLNTQNVTKQHRDLSIRLENAKKSRDRLMALLDKAQKVEDILKIEEQLRRLTTEIEQVTGELRYLDDQVALSTVTVTFDAVAPEKKDGRRPSRFGWINAIGVDRVLQWF